MWWLIGMLVFIALMGVAYNRGWFDRDPDDPHNDGLGPW